MLKGCSIAVRPSQQEKEIETRLYLGYKTRRTKRDTAKVTSGNALAPPLFMMQTIYVSG